MIPQRGTSSEDLNAAVNNEIASSDKQAKDAIKNNKPALYKSIAARGIQYVMILGTVGSIGYKLFFYNSDKKIQKKVNTGQVKQDKQVELAQSNIDKGGKGKIVNSKDSIETIDKNSLINDYSTVDVRAPSLALPTLPNVPKLDVSEIEPIKSKNEQKTYKSQEESYGAQEVKINVPPKIEMSNSPINNMPGNLPGGGMPPSLPAKQSYAMNSNDLGNINGKDAATRAQDAINEMFILSGQGPNQATDQARIATGSKKDFMIFGGSSLEIRSTSLDQGNSTKSQKINNLDRTIVSGKVMEATLETAIDSSLPGTVRAVVSRDVIGEQGDDILIPAGSRLYGTYSSTVTQGQARLAITWNKVIRPDGLSITMNWQATDQFGRAGLEGDVDTKYMEMFQNSMLLSFITLGTAIAAQQAFNIGGQSQVVNNNGSVATTNITPANAAVQSVISTATDIAKQMAQGLVGQVQPVISIPHGMLLKVMANQDLVISEPYRKLVASSGF